jgi:hypothetical protein
MSGQYAILTSTRKEQTYLRTSHWHAPNLREDLHTWACKSNHSEEAARLAFDTTVSTFGMLAASDNALGLDNIVVSVGR